MESEHIVPKGTRVIVHGNMEQYAAAYVEGHVWDPNTQRTSLILRWPNTPGGARTSKVWEHDEGSVWHQYNNVN